MILFINTVAKNSYLWLFDEKRNLIKETYFEIKWNESSLLLPKIEDFLKENNFDYPEIKNFVLVNWPWSFTWIRTVVLAINTISFITKQNITPINYFDLFKKYPIIKSSSKRDSFFKKDKDFPIEIIENEKIFDYLQENGINQVFWDTKFEKIETLENIDYYDIIKEIKLKDLNKFMLKLQNMRPWEEVLMVVKRHWIVYVMLFIYFFSGVIVTFMIFFFFWLNTWWYMLNIILWLILSIILYIEWLNHELDMYVVTNNRVIGLEQIAFLNRAVTECNLWQIQEVNSKAKWLFANIFNYWTLSIQTAGSKTTLKMEFCPDVMQTSRKILNVVDNYRDEKNLKENPEY